MRRLIPFLLFFSLALACNKEGLFGWGGYEGLLGKCVMDRWTVNAVQEAKRKTPGTVVRSEVYSLWHFYQDLVFDWAATQAAKRGWIAMGTDYDAEPSLKMRFYDPKTRLYYSIWYGADADAPLIIGITYRKP